MTISQRSTSLVNNLPGARLVGALCVLAAVLLGSSRQARAHEKWLEVEPAVASVPTATKVYLATGEALQKAELLPLRQRSRLGRFQLVSSSGRRDLLAALHEDAQPIAVLPAGTFPAGTSVLLLDTLPVDIFLDAEKFQAYLLEEKLIDVLAQRVERREEEAPGRERYSRSLKALVQVGPSTDPKLAASALAPTGQALDIVPAVNPYALGAGGKLAVQVLFHGQPLPGRALSFANRWHSHVVTHTVRTSEQGRAEVLLERSGDWLISLVHMERSKEAAADWRSYWASLCFSLPAKAP